MDEKDYDKTFIAKIEKLLPDEKQRTLFIATLLGSAGLLVEFVMERALEEKVIAKLPHPVAYAISLISANMIALISDGEMAQIKDLQDGEYEMGEQTQERIYRKMKWIIETLYHELQERDKVEV